jgi:NADH-quinone oxidoreductase subunit H
MIEGFGWTLLKAVLPWFFVLQMIPVMIWLERKGSALIADRTGPNRAFIPGLGLRLAGMIHNFADVVKLLLKEEFVPNHVNRRFYVLAPILSLTVALMVGAVIPFTPKIPVDGGWFQVQAIHAGVGLLYVLAISSLGVYAITLAGWASNNKYSLLGGLRGSAQMISYEIAVGLALVGVFLVYGTVSLDGMVEAQAGLVPEQPSHAYFILPRWGVFVQPIGFVLMLIGGFAETNRNPFDLAEGESEIVGFHVEYGAVKFALFFMAEYVHIVVISLLIATVFFGGYELPYFSHVSLAKPGAAQVLLYVILIGTLIAGLYFGYRLLRWHGVNRLFWNDSRKNEGAVLSVLFGFAPALTAIIVLWLWGGELSEGAAAIVAGIFGALVLIGKTLFFCWLFVWVRWTTPRFRYDQLMNLGWKLLIPVGIANILLTGLMVKLGIW